MFIDTCVTICVMPAAKCFGIFLRRKIMFVHKANPNYFAKCLTHVKCMFLLKCHKVNMILI